MTVDSFVKAVSNTSVRKGRQCHDSTSGVKSRRTSSSYQIYQVYKFTKLSELARKLVLKLKSDSPEPFYEQEKRIKCLYFSATNISDD